MLDSFLNSELRSGLLQLLRSKTQTHLSLYIRRNICWPHCHLRIQDIISARSRTGPTGGWEIITHTLNTGSRSRRAEKHQPLHPDAIHMAGDNRQEWAPDLEHTSFAQSEHSLHWVEISCIYSLNVSTQHSGRCLKDTISCPWNNLHWVVGRAESYWLRLTLVSAHSKTENRLTGAP